MISNAVLTKSSTRLPGRHAFCKKRKSRANLATG